MIIAVAVAAGLLLCFTMGITARVVLATRERDDKACNDIRSAIDELRYAAASVAADRGIVNDARRALEAERKALEAATKPARRASRAS